MREFASDFEVGECWGYNRYIYTLNVNYKNFTAAFCSVLLVISYMCFFIVMDILSCKIRNSNSAGDKLRAAFSDLSCFESDTGETDYNCLIQISDRILPDIKKN